MCTHTCGVGFWLGREAASLAFNVCRENGQTKVVGKSSGVFNGVVGQCRS